MKVINDSFKICTYNCNGLSNFKKRKDVFEYLRCHSKDTHIFCLQETHLKSCDENFIRSNWGFDVHVCGCDSNKNGVAILFSNNFDYKVFDVIKDPNGCYIVMNIEFLKRKITLVNIYGPSSRDNPDFFNEVCCQINSFDNEHIIITGDWNCPLDMELDVRNYLSTANRPRTRKKIFDMMAEYGMYDAFRELYSDKRTYTWRKFNTIKQARLDYFLISEMLMADVSSIDVLPSYRSDHSPVLLSFKKESFVRDRPFWKFNNSLLKDKNYISEIKELMLDVEKRYAALVYNLDCIDNIPKNEITLRISDQLFFEVMLMEIRGKTISFSTHKKRNELYTEHELEKEIKKIEENVTDSALENLENLKTQLQELRNKRIEGIAVRSRIRWINEGEKVSKYFCNLENRNFLDKSMNCLERENGVVITDQKTILAEVQDFYKNLYSFRDVADIDVSAELFNCNVPIVSIEDRTLTEGLITYKEAAEALKHMKNCKSPGPDGFTVEFYKFFFIDLGYFLVRSVNEGFFKQELSVTQRQGIIVCIPKEGKSKRFIKNWRPISLLNTAYKIASSCIANRLKIILPSIIHHCQTGFLKGRYIGENIRLLYDTLVYTEKNNIPGMLLLVDFQKAFDSVSWSFLRKCLEYFQFGPDLIRWIKTFYCNANTCILINGQYSSWFPIERGVRQGDPASPYLYLICAEILSIMIRNNNLIKGIKIKERENLLSQFADDTTLCLDGSEQSFNEAVSVLIKFASMSGLEINFEKTQVVWIGRSKNCNIKYMRDKNFIWDPGTFQILGIKFSTDIDTICRINFEGKLTDIKRSLNIWRNRQLTPLGKITIMKTLIISKIVHLLICLPDPPGEFIKSLDNELFSFLWNGKQSKIKKSVVCKSYLDGGLKMIDVKSFLSSMKVSWIRKLTYDSNWKSFTKNMFPDLDVLEYYGVEYVNIAMKRINNPFWKDVLNHYRKLSLKCKPTDIHEFMSECIHYNANILRERRTIFVKEWCENNIFFVNQLVNDVGNFMSFEEFLIAFPDVNRTNFLTYQGILNAIKGYQRKLNVVLANSYKTGDSVNWKIIKKGNKTVKSMFLFNKDSPTALAKWNNLFENLNWNAIFNHCYKVTEDVQLRWFQCRVLHRLLPTEKYLFLCKIKDSALCNFCQNEDQSIQHMLYSCDIVKQFWENFQELIINKCQHCHNFMLNQELTLFGVKDNFSTDCALDMMILLGKFYIYKCKLQDSIPRIQGYIAFLKNRYKLEKYVAAVNYKSDSFHQKWLPYFDIIL